MFSYSFAIYFSMLSFEIGVRYYTYFKVSELSQCAANILISNSGVEPVKPQTMDSWNLERHCLTLQSIRYKLLDNGPNILKSIRKT